MATEFRAKDGTLVAVRYWGGIHEGTKVCLRLGAANVTMKTRLRGDDGSRETLVSLALQVGAGAIPLWAAAGGALVCSNTLIGTPAERVPRVAPRHTRNRRGGRVRL